MSITSQITQPTPTQCFTKILNNLMILQKNRRTNVNGNLKAVTLLVAPHSYTPLLHSSLPNFVMHPAGQTNTASPFFPKFSTHCQCVMQLLVLPITLLHTFVTHLCYMPLVHVFVTRLCYTMSCLSRTFVTCVC